MKLKLFLLALLTSPFSIGSLLGSVDVTTLPLIPAPKEIKAEAGSLSIAKINGIYTTAQTLEVAKILQSSFKSRYGRTLPLRQYKESAHEGGIALILQSGGNAKRESYTMSVSEHGVIIKAPNSAGIFYGICTLMQLFVDENGGSANTIPAIKVKDEPRFGYRGLMLDPARNFLPMEEVKAFVSVMATYKFNTLHFHLSDDQGWRIEMKNPKLRKLHEVGSTKNNPSKSKRAYYTQEELRDLVAFAKKYNVEIIPEIDMPGHSMGVITTFPNLACEGVQEINRSGKESELKKHPKMKIRIWSEPGVSEALLCAGNPDVFKMYEAILNEVCDIFPSKKFHIGGDEAPIKCWTMCPKCQALMKQKKMKRPQELMSYFFAEMNKILEKKGKTPLYWYELDVPEYPKNAIAYAWRMGLSEKAINRAQKDGYGIICSPGEHAYLDYPNIRGGLPQPNWGMPITTLEKSYKFDPGYGRAPQDQAHILGVEGTLWGEHIETINRAYYMAYPRGLAVVEAGWTPMSRRNWENFKTRAKPVILDMHKRGIPAYWPKEVYGEEPKQ